jgi:hypothetical protein
MGLKAVATLVPGGGPPVGGSGSSPYVAKWSGTSTLTTGILVDTGSSVGILTTSPVTTFQVGGNTVATPSPVGAFCTLGSNSRFTADDGTRAVTLAANGTDAIVGTTTAHDLLLQRGNVTAITLGASGAVTFAGNLTSSAAQTWALATGTNALNIASNLLNLDTTNSRVGVGTASPTGRLHVVGGTASSGNGTPITLIAQNGQASGNTNGGNIVLTPGSPNGSGTPGLVDLSSPSGTGLKLPATPGNADTQTLDCYAEGTWAPTLTGFGGTTPTISAARYTRVGRQVTVQVWLSATGGASYSGTRTTTLVALPAGMTPAVSSPGNMTDSAIETLGTAAAYTNGNLYWPTFAATTADTFLTVTYTV